MTLRKKTIGNSVKFIPQNKQIQDRDIKPKTIKNISVPRKQVRNVLQNNKKLIVKT